jgi:hypothetical protein
LCKEDKEEWEENIHIRRMTELGIRKGDGRTSILSSRERNIYNQRVTVKMKSATEHFSGC